MNMSKNGTGRREGLLFVYFGLWILFNGRADFDVLVSGAFAALLVYAFTWKIVGLSPKRELAGWKRAWKYLCYFGYLLVEIYKANVQTLGLVFNPKAELEPQLVRYKTGCREDYSRVLLANSITLTPGTITVSQDEDELVIHALDRETAEGLVGNGFETRLRAIEEGK